MKRTGQCTHIICIADTGVVHDRNFCVFAFHISVITDCRSLPEVALTLTVAFWFMSGAPSSWPGKLIMAVEDGMGMV